MACIANVDVPEIEVTPKMIEAGVEAFLCHDGKVDSEEETVKEIFRVMYRLIPPR